jgi:uncharacterized protein YndB with AHSA1/START domain
MTDRSADHASFTLERTFAAAPSRVFAAFADPVVKARWFMPPAEWGKSSHDVDFRVGGHEHLDVESPDGRTHTFNGTYRDIVEGERVIFAYEMLLDGERISVSLTTIELEPAGTGTHLAFTEQAVFLDGFDDAGSREEGSVALLANLEADIAAHP